MISASSSAMPSASAPATYRTAVGFVAILVMLTFRPRGILGERAT